MTSAAIGLFGKIPAQGDFLQRDLPTSFTRPWDQWLQGGIVAARTALGSAWVETYNQAPIWRFALAAGLAGPTPVIGLIMPSVDRVGRAYPVTLAATLEGAPGPWRAMAENNAIFPLLEKAALACLEEGHALDDLERALRHINPVAAFPFSVSQSGDGVAMDAALPPGSPIAEEQATASLSADLTDRWISERLGPASVWVSAFGDQAEELALMHAGLPTPARFLALMRGDPALWRVGDVAEITTLAAGTPP